MKETELAKHFTDYLSCYDLYFEVGTLSGCVDIVSTERTYISGNDKLVLSGNTYHWYDHYGYVWTGRYEEDATTILIILDSPLPSILMTKENNNTLKYKNDVWEMQ